MCRAARNFGGGLGPNRHHDVYPVSPTFCQQQSGRFSRQVDHFSFVKRGDIDPVEPIGQFPVELHTHAPVARAMVLPSTATIRLGS